MLPSLLGSLVVACHGTKLHQASGVVFSSIHGASAALVPYHDSLISTDAVQLIQARKTLGRTQHGSTLCFQKVLAVRAERAASCTDMQLFGRQQREASCARQNGEHLEPATRERGANKRSAELARSQHSKFERLPAASLGDCRYLRKSTTEGREKERRDTANRSNQPSSSLTAHQKISIAVAINFAQQYSYAR